MRFLIALLAAATFTTSAAFADTMAAPTATPHSMKSSSMKSDHMSGSMKSNHMSGSMKSNHMSGSMKSTDHMMGTPKAKATTKP